MNYGEAGLQVREVAAFLKRLQNDMESRPGAYTYADKGLLHRLLIYTDSLPMIADALLEKERDEGQRPCMTCGLPLTKTVMWMPPLIGPATRHEPVKWVVSDHVHEPKIV